jgi:TPP-dependent pyruvate/acetoin dehydrogenase alpha subunit
LNIGFLGSNGITGGMTAVATGAALSQAVLKTGRVVLCFLGDGATGQGVFWEAVNMAIVWRLPIVYLCENNQYAMSLHISRAFGEPSVAKRLSGYGLPTRTVDGMDYLAVRAATEAAVKHARGGEGPVLIEAMTYRFCGHSKSDECAYRNREEEEEWRRRDPLLIMRDWLCGRGVIDGAADEKLRQKVVEEIDKAVEYARSSPDPDPATVRCHLFGGCYSAGET